MKLGKYYDELSTTCLKLSNIIYVILGIKNAKATLFIALLHLILFYHYTDCHKILHAYNVRRPE